MTRLFAVLSALASAVVLALVPSAFAAEPPNQNDPCSTAGRNTCGTTGVGFYDTYRYGVRWFGDYRGAVAGELSTFCIDLRFWYPNKNFAFEQAPVDAELRNRAGQVVSATSERRMAYALWNYGRSRNATQQAATMLYVHSLMGDGAPGEVDPSAISPVVASEFGKIERDSRRFAGPYRIETKIPGSLTTGTPATATFRVLSAAGNALPNVSLEVKATGTDTPRTVTTNGEGVASVDFTPTSADGVNFDVRSEPIASNLPKIYRGTTAAAARNGQRLAAPDSQRVTATSVETVALAQVGVATAAAPTVVLAGEANRDKVTFSGVSRDWKALVAVNIYGPYRSQAEIRCDKAPAWTGSFTKRGPGVIRTPAASLTAAGNYTYQLVVPDTPTTRGTTTPCAVPAESFRVESQPKITTVASATRIRPGTALTDLVTVTGLAGESAVVTASLYGPFPSREAIKCDISPIWTGSVNATGDGDYRTEPVTLTVPGYYTYRETIDAAGFVRAAETACGETTETATVVGAPKVTTQISAQETTPGASITDSVVVTGLGAVAATINVELWGPFPSPGAIVCIGTPYWTGTVAADGDGTFTTDPVKLDKAGYYTYRETLAGSEANDAVATTCGEASETTIARGTPVVTTIVADEVVRPGSTLSDRIRVTGLGKTPAQITVELFGPFSSRGAISCTGTPFWRGTVTANGDGEVRSAPVRVPKAGLYTYREEIAGSAVVAGTTTECAQVAETALSAPAINTGRGDRVNYVRALQVPGNAPTRVQIASLGIDAPTAAVGIDLTNGALGVPVDIQRPGWWRDGAAPGDAAGAVLIGGHVDSARSGAGAFFRLKSAKAGDRVVVQTAGGTNRGYRVVSVRTMPKPQLPTNVYSLKGSPRLVLVTCGGPFVPSLGHYRDNIVVTAVPA